MRNLLLGLTLSLASCVAEPAYTQVQPLPRASFDPQYVDAFGGSPEVIPSVCWDNLDRMNATDDTGGVWNNKEFFTRLIIKEFLRQLFLKEGK